MSLITCCWNERIQRDTILYNFIGSYIDFYRDIKHINNTFSQLQLSQKYCGIQAKSCKIMIIKIFFNKKQKFWDNWGVNCF
jgi:hypothetical protein